MGRAGRGAPISFILKYVHMTLSSDGWVTVMNEKELSRKFVNMAKEMAMKASIYNGFIKAMA